MTLNEVQAVLNDAISRGLGHCEARDETGKGIVSVSVLQADRAGQAVKVTFNTDVEGG